MIKSDIIKIYGPVVTRQVWEYMSVMWPMLIIMLICIEKLLTSQSEELREAWSRVQTSLGNGWNPINSSQLSGRRTSIGARCRTLGWVTSSARIRYAHHRRVLQTIRYRIASNTIIISIYIVVNINQIAHFMMLCVMFRACTWVLLQAHFMTE